MARMLELESAVGRTYDAWYVNYVKHVINRGGAHADLLEEGMMGMTAAKARAGIGTLRPNNVGFGEFVAQAFSPLPSVKRNPPVLVAPPGVSGSAPLIRGSVDLIDDIGNAPGNEGYYLGNFAGDPVVEGARTQRMVQSVTDARSMLRPVAVLSYVGAAGNLARTLSGAFKAGGTLPATVRVYRVEGVANARIVIGEGGTVAIADSERMLFLNFGSRARAEEFLARRVAQGMEGAAMKGFKVPSSFLDDLRSSAVDESLAGQFPGRPLIVDTTKAADQFGLRAAQIEELRKAILQGTGETIK